MIDTAKLENILFLDVETVSQKPNYKELDEETKKLWDTKAASLKKQKETETSADIYNRAPIYAEFGKIICISVGFIASIKGKRVFRVKSFYDTDEKVLLENFISLLNKSFNRKDAVLCAHNGKEFDFPYLGRRIIINGLKLPKALQLIGKKPWEVPHLDTMELWRFGDYKAYTSLKLLAHALRVATPKDDIDGSMVNKVYWQDRDLKRIVAYCQKDVLTVAQILLRLRGEELLQEKEVVIV